MKDEREGKVFVDSTRSGGATVVAAYSPRVRPGTPVSFPVTWETVDAVTPSDFTIHTAPALLDGAGAAPGPAAWTDAMAHEQALPGDLVAEGHTIPVARVAAMHEGKRRKRRAGSPGGFRARRTPRARGRDRGRQPWTCRARSMMASATTSGRSAWG